ncbi:MAG TPA: substrate-binding domain-containing protein [Pseudonocardiaceae bacterium]
MSLFAWSVVIPAVASAASGVTAVINTVKVLWPSPHRWISYRVHLDAPIGSRPDIKGLAELVVRRTRNNRTRDLHHASMVLVRVSNDSGANISDKDYVQPAILTFGSRQVVGVEIKDADDAQRRSLLGSGPNNVPKPGEDVLAFDESDQGANWLRLPKMDFNRGERFRMMVLLQGHGTGVDGSAKLHDGRGPGLQRETGGIAPSRATRRALVFGTLATALLLVVTFVVLFGRPQAAPPATCGNGSLVVSGSTAFQPSESDIATHYHQTCPNATVSVNPSGHPTGSHQGALDLVTNGRGTPSVRTGQVAMSDGPESGYPELVPHPVAVIVFSMVVNKSTGVHSLTAAQLREIYSGQITNWSAIGGANVPIDIVSRGTDSGTRSTFDQKILGNAAEPPADSYNCTERDPSLPSSPVIRCEMQSTGDVLSQVNAIPGAIGYAEMSVTSSAETSQYQNVQQVQLNGYDPDPESVKNMEYPFWTVEYFYTYGIPADGSLTSAFLSYMANDAAKAIMQSYGHIPCTDESGNTITLCQ